MSSMFSSTPTAVSVAPFPLCTAYGGSDGADEGANLANPCSSGTKAGPAAKAAAPSGDGKGWAKVLSQADLVSYGKQLFLAKGSKTCNDYHGRDAKKGRLEQAADLTTPANWKATKALGGHGAKVTTALTYLIASRAKNFNKSFPKEKADIGWDWSKTGETNHDIQMFGVTQSSTQAELKKIRKTLKKNGVVIVKSELTTFGTKAVLAYLESIKE